MTLKKLKTILDKVYEKDTAHPNEVLKSRVENYK